MTPLAGGCQLKLIWRIIQAVGLADQVQRNSGFVFHWDDELIRVDCHAKPKGSTCYCLLALQSSLWNCIGSGGNLHLQNISYLSDYMDPMLASCWYQRRRRWHNMKPALDQSLVFAAP